MNDPTPSLSPNKQALLKIRELKQQLAEASENTNHPPVAVVSMACRFPNSADTPEKFWQSLIKQEDLVGDIPEDRWDMDAFYDEDPDVPGKMYARRGVFLDDVASMDPEFFGISPREATWVDPQQRLLMEVGWEAIERAGWIPEEIADHTGVFVGWMHNDYQNEASDSFLNLNPYIATGAAGSFLCGRLAWYLGLRGPSLAVDTACSSSLVALHLAIQSLGRRDCDRALVGGVNAICSPTTNILTCKLKALSPSGHSRAFDAAADGYLRGEGCGVVTLRRLSDAQRDGDKILGIIRGSAIGHNGAGSGLTVPNPKAQEDVIRKAIHQAGLEPNAVDYLEAHGTGTSLGDPIEVNAASAAYCEHRDASHPLLIGSVKTNIGHLEAAAGMAGLIKVLLSLQNGSIPGQMNFETPNPHIAWDKTPVKVLTKETNWPDPQRRIAGVSAFGMSGTNAHVIVEAPDSAVRDDDANEKPSRDLLVNETTPSNNSNGNAFLITLSGKNESAVIDLATHYAKALANPDVDPLHFAHQSNVSRSHFDHRAAIVAHDREDAIRSLKSLVRGSKTDGVYTNHHRRAPRVAWQFTGQGAQFVSMGKQLYESQPTFREAIDFCDQQLSELRERSLIDVMFHDASDPPSIDQTQWTQPAIFALQMGLAKLLQSWNLQPAMVLGHSVGQYAAACVAGIMSWEDGLRLIAERGRLIGELPSGGLMLAVFAPPAAVTSAVENVPGVSIAALNGTHVVVSGEQDSIRQVEAAFEQRSVRTKVLTTSHAFHSHLMDDVLEPFAAIAGSINFKPATMPLICNISGKVLAADAKLDGKYWANHIRQAVAFAPAIEALDEMNCDLLLELGPQSVLTRMAASKWAQSPDALIGCLQKDTSDDAALLDAMARMYASGATPNFRAMHRDKKFAQVDLPTYPFQRRRFWGPDKPRAAHADFHTAHPLLGTQISLAGAGEETRSESFIDVDSPAWMPDHEVMGSVVLPGSALIEMAIEAASGGSIANATFEQPVRPSGRTAIQTVIRNRKSENGETQTMEVFAQAADSQNWSRHFSCELLKGASPPVADIDPESLTQPDLQNASIDEFYETMQGMGLNYGPAFRCIQSLRYSATEVVADLQVAGDVRGYNVPPTLLDAAFHSLAVGLLRTGETDLFLPVGISSLKSFGPIETEAICHAKWTSNEGSQRTADLKLFSKTGKLLLEINELKVNRVSLAALRQMSGTGAERLVYHLEWKPNPFSPDTLEPKRWLLVRGSDQRELSAEIKQKLLDANHQVTEQSSQLIDVDDWTARLEALAGPTADAQSEETDANAQPVAPPFDGVIWLLSQDEPDLSKTVFDAEARSVVAFTQAMIANQFRRLPCGLLLVTQNGIAVGASDADCPAVRPQQTQFWGLGRVIGAEQPELRCRMLDVDSNESETASTIDLLLEVAQTETADNQFTARDGQLFSPRMQQTRLSKTAFQANSEKSYLITGGLGMLGREVASWLAEKGATEVVLVSRRDPDESATAFIRSIEDKGCQVVVHSADMSNRADVEKLLARFGNDLKPLTGVVHAAGVLDDGLIESQTAERFEKVLQPKIAAARLLHELTATMQLDLFVLYSSAASVLGSPGQSNYALGNAFLDGLSFQRRSAGLPSVSINWGPWKAGMADDERIQKRLALQGITPLEIDEAHAALEKLIASQTVQATVMDVDWRRMRTGPGGEVPATLQDLVGKRKKASGATSALVSKLRTMSGAAQRELLLSTIQGSLQGILSTPDAPETDRPLIEMGLDSLMAVEFGTELQQMLGDQFNVGPTMLFDHPTIDAICDHVLELVTADVESNSESAAAKLAAGSEQAASTTMAVAREDIAIIGMSCRFPGARDVHEFWQNLLDGVDSVCDIPPDRWDIDRFYSKDRQPGKMYTRQGGFLDDIAEFDASFFNISDQEACWIDPQHRMLLENSYRALEDAGIPTSPLADPSVGVFMGIMGSDYAFLPTLEDDHVIKGFQGAGLSHSAGVGRISYLFGFEGPSVSVDTASSSSLVAVFQAMRSLQEGTCNLALAGGSNAILVPVNSLLMSKAGLLSEDGRCKSFSADAKGFGRGEGCGVLVMKRLSDAQRDGNRIMAVIRGGAVVHNGFSGGITSPSGKAQSRVIGDAVKDAGISPSDVQYLEAHGTGTEYGDPMELGAAAKVYGKGRNRKDPLLVGSVKANISHLEAAGGSSGLIKTVLALHHGVIPQQIHFDEPSPHIPWKRMPMKMVTENTPWPESDQRTAGITALGLVGTNAHLILSGAPEASGEASEIAAEDSSVDSALTRKAKPQLLVLSARCENALFQLRKRYASWLEENSDVDLGHFCATLAAGRRHHEYRMAITVSSRDEAIDWLKTANTTNGSSIQPVKSKPGVDFVFGDDRETDLARLQSIAAISPIVADFIAASNARLQEHTGEAKSFFHSEAQEETTTPSDDFDPQVVAFLVQASLFKLYETWGVTPDAAWGIGIGQYSAACAAGCLCWLDALVLVFQRSQLQRGSDCGDQKISEEDLSDFEALADQFNFYPPHLPLFCSLDGQPVAVHRSLGGSYWRRHVIKTACQETFAKALGESEHKICLLAGADDGIGNVARSGQTVCSINGNATSISMGLTTSLGDLYRYGCNPDFAAVFDDQSSPPLSLPTYPFQKQRYWITEISRFMEEENQTEVQSSQP